MNPEELKRKRKEKGLTQKEIAELIGVSTQTYNGYENGKVIPSTKYQILEKILSENYQVEEPKTKYGLTGYDLKIKQTEEEINIRKSMLEFLEESNPDYAHIKTIIKLLEERIELIKIAKKNHEEE